MGSKKKRLDIGLANHPAPKNAKKWIKRRGIMKKAVAEQMGVTQSQFSAILEGRRLLKVCELVKMAEALNVDAGILLEEKDS